MGFLIWWFFSLAVRKVRCTSQGNTSSSLIFLVDKSKNQHLFIAVLSSHLFFPGSSRVMATVIVPSRMPVKYLPVVVVTVLPKCTACQLLTTCSELECGNWDTSCIFLLDLGSSLGRCSDLPCGASPAPVRWPVPFCEMEEMGSDAVRQKSGLNPQCHTLWVRVTNYR